MLRFEFRLALPSAFHVCTMRVWNRKESHADCCASASASHHPDDGSRSRPTGDCNRGSEFLSDGRVFNSDQDEHTAERNPQGVGVANQALIQSQQDIRFADAAENISGVNRDVLLAGDVGNALTIRGLPLGIFSNYYRDGFAFDGMVPSDATDADRVEILKGPASVLYGRATSSGIVNLITKEPLPSTHYTFTFQGDRFGAVRPTFDITGPIGTSDKLFYRLNAELADTSTFRDYFHDRRYFLAPALTWRPEKATSIRFLVEYMHGSTTTGYGIPALGDRPAPVPISS